MMGGPVHENLATVTAGDINFVPMRPSKKRKECVVLLKLLNWRYVNETKLVSACVLVFHLTQDYSTEGLTPSQMTLLQQLRQFGLIYQRKVE